MIRFLKYKNIIVFSLVFLLTFFVVTDFKREEVKASALTGVIGGFTLGGLGEGAASAIVLGGPYVAAFAVVCIAAGIVYKNREEIGAGLTNAYNYAQSLGKNLVDFFETDSNGNVTVKAEGVDLIRGSVKNYMANPTSVNGHIGDFNIAPNISATKPSITNINFPVSESDSLLLNIKSNFDAFISSDFLVNGKSEVYLGNIFDLAHYPNGMYVYISYDSSGYSTAWDLSSLNSLLYSVKNKTNTYRTSNSICSDFSINVKNSRAVSGSISVDRLLGNSIGDSTSVDSEVTFRNPSLESNKDISVSIPTDLTWDKVIDKTYDNTLPATTGENTETGTGEGTGILDGIKSFFTGLWDLLKGLLNTIIDILKAILSFLKDFLLSLLNGIKDLLLSLFVPSDTFFIDNFNKIKNNFSNKLNYDTYLDLFNRQYSENGIKDVTINWNGQEIVIVKFTMFNKFKDFVQIACYAFFFFLLAIYNYNQIYKLIRGTDMVSAGNTIGHMHGELTPSEQNRLDRLNRRK